MLELEHCGEKKGPNIFYHSYFAKRRPFFSVALNPDLCHDLFESMGMPQEKIESKAILIHPESKLFQLGGLTRVDLANYSKSEQTINLYPSSLWGTHQGMIGLTEIAIKGMHHRKYFYYLDPPGKAHTGRYEQTFCSPEVIKDARRVLHKNASKFVGEKNKMTFLELVQERELGEAEKLIKENMNRMLRFSLAHEMKHAVDNPFVPSGVVQNDLITAAAFLASMGTIYLAGQVAYPDKASEIISTFGYTAIALTSNSFIKKYCRALFYKLDPYELRANSFAGKIADDPQWNDLVKTGRGWN